MFDIVYRETCLKTSTARRAPIAIAALSALLSLAAHAQEGWNLANARTAEMTRYKAALEKMFIPGAGVLCKCGVCYVCIAMNALQITNESGGGK